MATSFFNNNCEDEVEELESAKQYADLARDWAIKMDGLVDGIDFSSKFWANQAAIGAGARITIKEDGTPLGDQFTTLNFGAGVTATQTTTNEVLIQSTGQILVETFDDGVDFTAGTSDDIALSVEAVSKNNIDIYFDGIYQNKETYDVSGVLVTFTSVIPVGVGEIEVVYPRLMDVGIAAAENVTFGSTNVDAELVSLDARLDVGEATLISLDSRLTIVERSTLVNRPFPNVAAVDTATFLQTGDFVEWLGYTTPGDGGGNKGEIGTGFGTADNGSVFDLSGSGLQAKGLFPGGVNVKQFGAAGDDTANDVVPIQNAINYCITNKLALKIPAGVYLVDSVDSINSRPYALIIDGSISIYGEGIGQSIIKAIENGVDGFDILRTPLVASLRNITIRDFAIDGIDKDYHGIGTSGRNFWFANVENLVFENILSLNTDSFGIAIDNSTHVVMANIVCDHGSGLNTDGVHFRNTSNVVISGMDIFTGGDDSFVIEASTSDVKNYNVSALNISSTAGRAILIAIDARNGTFIDEFTATNIHIDATIDGALAGMVVQQINLNDSIISLTAKNVDQGVFLISGWDGSEGMPAFDTQIKNNIFNIITENTADAGIRCSSLNSSLEPFSGNRLTGRVINPNDGTVGSTFLGSNWDVDYYCDYDPEGTKINKLQALVINCTNSRFSPVCFGADIGVQLQSGSDHVNIHDFSLTGNDTYDINLSGAPSNISFSNGRLDGTSNLSGSFSFSNVIGATNRGRITLTPNGSGQDVIPHGLFAIPDFFQVNVFSGAQVIATVNARDSTNLTVTFRDYSGSLITTGTYQVTWEASVS